MEKLKNFVKNVPFLYFLVKSLRKIKRAHRYCVWHKPIDDIKEIVLGKEEGRRILHIGCGKKNIHPGCINMDVFPTPVVHVIGDAHYLPVKKETFDSVWMEAVLEHVKNPARVIGEAYRVLKPEGYIYIEIPFFQGYHPSPGDYQRFTHEGLRELCKDFEEIKSGAVSGPASAFSHVLRNFLAYLFSFHSENVFNFLYYYVFGWITGPWKYLDVILIKHPLSSYLCFGLYFLGKKK